jgi:VanZ family protein
VLKNLYFWIAFSWTVVVAYFCLAPASDIPSVSIPNLDKLAHSFFHFVLTKNLFLFFKKKLKKKNQTKLLVGAVFFSLFFGIGIEVLQSRLTTTRNGDFFDVLANFTGALLALVFVVVAKQIRKKHT